MVQITQDKLSIIDVHRKCRNFFRVLSNIETCHRKTIANTRLRV